MSLVIGHNQEWSFTASSTFSISIVFPWKIDQFLTKQIDHITANQMILHKFLILQLQLASTSQNWKRKCFLQSLSIAEEIPNHFKPFIHTVENFLHSKKMWEVLFLHHHNRHNQNYVTLTLVSPQILQWKNYIVSFKK